MSNLIICGFKGAGKTTFGKKLADCLLLPFLDTDEEIARRVGKSPRELFKIDDGITFRQLEKEVIRSLQNLKDHVIALGGGTLCDPTNRQTLLKMGLLLYLKVDKETLYKRVDSFPFPNFEQTFAERTALFESLPVITIEGASDGQ